MVRCSAARASGATAGSGRNAQARGALSEYEVQYWLRQFGITEASETGTPAVAAEPGEASDELPSDEAPANPFPPGYAEDITEDDV